MAGTNDYARRTSIYDVEYDDERDLAFLDSLVTEGVRSILELPCGTGRKAMHLGRTGRRVVGVDLEPAMIERFRRKLAARDEGANVEAVTGDMRHLDLGETFDLVVVAREAFQLLTRLDDARQALHAFRKHLAPRGTLMLDLASFRPVPAGCPDYPLSYYDPALPDGVWQRDWSRETPDGATVTRWHRQSTRAATIGAELHYELETRDTHETFRASMELRRYELADIEPLLREADFAIRHLYADHARHPYVDGSARMVLLAQPRAGRGAFASEGAN